MSERTGRRHAGDNFRHVFSDLRHYPALTGELADSATAKLRDCGHGV